MANIDHYSPGSFCWFELGTTDQNAAKSFYKALFGWDADDMPMGPEGVYSMFTLEGRNTGAAYTLMAEMRAHGVPPHWAIYVAVESADDAAAKAVKAGGTLIKEPFDVFDVGRMAVVKDPTGAVFHAWQEKRPHSNGISGVPGTFCWADLCTRDVDAAARFYSEVFGWQITKGENDSSGYLHIKNGEAFIGGIPPAQFLPRQFRLPAHQERRGIHRRHPSSAISASQCAAALDALLLRHRRGRIDQALAGTRRRGAHGADDDGESGPHVGGGRSAGRQLLAFHASAALVSCSDRPMLFFSGKPLP